MSDRPTDDNPRPTDPDRADSHRVNPGRDPAASDAVRIDAARRIDEICDAYEASWTEASVHKIPDHLHRMPAAYRDKLLLQLLKIDHEFRGGGADHARAFFLPLFPDAESVISLALGEADARQYSTADGDSPEWEFVRGDRIGKFEVLTLVGKGSFGAVYLANHPELLGKEVAIKVPNRIRFGSREECDRFIEDARLAIDLKHKGIVSVYDVGFHVVENDGCNGGQPIPYIVQEFLGGGDLKQALKRKRFTLGQSASLVADVADALCEAHAQGILHRDLKPGNILLTHSGDPCIADFGLAIRASIQKLRTGEVCGAPPYMSPEQIQGESHRIDCRSDLWSLGVIFFEVLTGELPFSGATWEALRSDITTADPPRPSELNAEIPHDLERICLKCLAPSKADRYANAEDLVADLRQWLARGHGDAGHKTNVEYLSIRPHGLRPFGPDDADNFLRLLPGLSNSSGVPDSIAFWQSRIEATDEQTTFTVGLLYGPSGCGKTSFVQAGLLPRLDTHVLTISVEATTHDTEIRILKQLRKRFPQLSHHAALPELLAALRDGTWLDPGQKVLIVIDQFEQWLHGVPSINESQLVAGLRQCDGEHLQALVMVRDDFWMGVTRFMQALDIELDPGTNSRVVDQFDLAHARNVLRLFGRAYGRISDSSAEEKHDAEDFLKQAVEALAEQNRVICVRLAVLAEMLKDAPWRPETLKAAGGLDGIGVAFLDEVFHSPRANPTLRARAESARQLLEQLLPEPGAEIKGHLRSVVELKTACGHRLSDSQFHELLRILDRDLKLITPSDPVLGKSADQDAAAESRPAHYQLTHDFLVPTLRAWIYRTQLDTWRGRAALRLKERTALWNHRREDRQLPSLWEAARITAGTRPEARTPPQSRMLKRAWRYRSSQTGVFACFAALVIATVYSYLLGARILHVETVIAALVEAPPTLVEFEIRKLEGYEDLALPRLRKKLNETALDRRAELNTVSAIAALQSPDEQHLAELVHEADPPELGLIARAFTRFQPKVSAEQSAISELGNRYDSLPAADVAARWNYAAVLLQLGQVERFKDIMKNEGHTDFGTRLLVDFLQSAPDVDRLIDLLDEDMPPAALAGLCGIMGAFEDAVFSSQRVQIVDRLTGIYQRQGDAYARGYARWALKQFGAPCKEAPPSDRLIRDKNWFARTAGINMVQVGPMTTTVPRVRARKEPNESLMNNLRMKVPAFEISDAEITVGQFVPFLQEQGQDSGIQPEFLREVRSSSPTDNHPVVLISWEMALEYCNWLSEQEGYEKCYYQDGTAWKWRLDANGYRLPTLAEWHVACFGESELPYSFGNDEGYLAEFEHFREGEPCPVRSFRPNPRGLFDMCGNIGEWCWVNYDDEDIENNEISTDEPSQWYSGAQHNLGPSQLRKHEIYGFVAGGMALRAKGSTLIGFRVARSLENGAPAKPQDMDSRDETDECLQ